MNNNLTISDHVRDEKLPGALGLNMISKGILVITVGQLLGSVRDLTNSYILCLRAQNFLLLLVIAVWTPEMFLNHLKHLKEKRLAKLEEVTRDLEQQPLQIQQC